MIDPHFWESADIKKLDVFARYVFMSMFSHADDEGRNIGSAAYIRNITFPLEDVPLTKVKKAIDSIKLNLSVAFYEVNGEEYYQLTKWNEWQKVDHPSKSLFPALKRESLANHSRITRESLCPNIKEDKVKELERERTTTTIPAREPAHVDNVDNVDDFVTLDQMREAIDKFHKDGPGSRTRDAMIMLAIYQLIIEYADIYQDKENAIDITTGLVSDYGFDMANECIHHVADMPELKRPQVPSAYIREMCRNRSGRV
jgi:hypothetical protein